jgi:hypothetical protein
MKTLLQATVKLNVIGLPWIMTGDSKKPGGCILSVFYIWAMLLALVSNNLQARISFRTMWSRRPWQWIAMSWDISACSMGCTGNCVCDYHCFHVWSNNNHNLDQTSSYFPIWSMLSVPSKASGFLIRCLGPNRNCFNHFPSAQIHWRQ